ncbi:MAG: UDP-2,4-diacetamido-2,4,6-trideoxy-beta-L-altropyranose hydrolase [Candidatus Tectimicrobiota bacterium]
MSLPSSLSLPVPPLVIRADASPASGQGHVMRCLALAQTCIAQGGSVTFLGSLGHPSLQQRLQAAGCEVVQLDTPHPDPHDLQHTLAILALAASAAPTAIPWLVLDGYHFATAYQHAIRATGYRLLVLDDYAHLPAYEADILLNQNIHAPTLPYKCPPAADLLLGPRYALLRPEFHARAAQTGPEPAVARKVLLTLGGSDPHNVTQRLAQALSQVDIEGLEVTVVLGAYYRHQFASGPARAGLIWQVLHHVVDMAPLMSRADLVIAAGGSTCWELACLGRPAALVILAENQRQNAQGLNAAGAAVCLGWHTDLEPMRVTRTLRELLQDPTQRAGLAARARQLVDGRGAQRVLRQIHGQTLTLRPAQPADALLLWSWVNDPEVRRTSFTTDLISWEQHLQWFAARLQSDQCMIYIACSSTGAPLGQIRYDSTGQEATVSISLDKNFRHQGYGGILLKKASQLFLQHVPVIRLHAYIKPENIASQSAFLQAGFRQEQPVLIHGQQAWHFQWRKEDVA